MSLSKDTKERIIVSLTSEEAGQEVINAIESIDGISNIPANTIRGNNLGIPSPETNLTPTQTTAILNNFVGENGSQVGTKGLVPAPEIADGELKNKFLKADGSWSGQTGDHSSRKETLTAISGWSSSSTLANQWFGLSHSPDKELYVAVLASGSNRVQISRDAKSWRSISSIPTNVWTKICYSLELGRFVAVSFDGTNRSMYSDDGENWIVSTPPAGQWYDICWSPELRLFLAVGLGGANTAMTSVDGITWVGQNPLGQTTNFYCCCWSPELSLFVAIRLNGSAYTSPDGITWTQRNIGDKSWASVCWAKELGLFVAVGITGGNRCETSPDGITWTPRAIPASAWRKVTWSGDLGILLAVNSSSGIAYSYDGITWTSATSPSAGTQLYDVLWSKKDSIFVLASIAGTNRVLISRSVRNFTDSSSDLTLKRMTYSTTSTGFTVGENQRQALVVKSTGGACTVTIPLETTYNPKIGSQYRFAQSSTDAITFVATVGVTLISRGSLLTTNGQGSVVTLEKIGINTWLLSGDLT